MACGRTSKPPPSVERRSEGQKPSLPGKSRARASQIRPDSARDGAAENENADPGDDRRQDRDRPPEHSSDGEHGADDRYGTRHTSRDHEPVGTLLARPPRRRSAGPGCDVVHAPDRSWRPATASPERARTASTPFGRGCAARAFKGRRWSRDRRVDWRTGLGRAPWTDARLNDLVERLDKTLDRLDRDVRALREELRSEIAAVRRDGAIATVAIVAAIVGTGVLT